ncbi:hypothetical protein ACFV4P_03025 [Kitasatospora sp. NPDC059795]|uniref:hypothetical protein n=1 Tax=Kitasatospora sp. NPDC059795 TaxID=3346949 RepID=UPI003654284B
MGTQFYIETDTDTPGDSYDQSAGGMAVLLTLMREFGMLTDAEPPHPVTLDEFGLSPADFDGPPRAGKVKPEKADAFAAAQQAAQDRFDYFDPATTGIPHYKAAYNEGRLIAPQEITAALAAYDSRPAEQRREADTALHGGWTRWIAFLRQAAGSRFGIRVF